MKTSHTFAISFFLKMDKANKGIAPLYVKVTIDGKFKHLSTKKRVSISDWDQKQQTLLGHHAGNDVARNKIRMLTGEINTAYDELRFNKQFITAEAIIALVEGRNDEQVSLMDLLKYHKEGVGQLLAEGTTKNYMTTERLLEEFLLVKKRKKDIALIQLDPKFITDFGTFLRLRKPDKGQRPCANNTVMKHMERFKKLINMAIDNKWIIEDPFRRFERHIIKKDREALDEFELERLKEAVLLEAGFVIVQDMFLFSCHTGLGYAEACNLNRSHITRDRKGNYWLEMCRKKTFNTTEQKFEVLLLPEALELIDKYKNNPMSLQKGTIFPSYSNQTTNRYLKVIATLAKIGKNVTFHIARHTFATTIALENGVSIESVAHMLGHASIRTTQIYAKVRKKKVSNEMMAVKEKMHPNIRMVG